MKGIVITPESDISVQEFHEPLYKKVGAVVGGLIEIVRPFHLPKPYCMIVNDDGLLMNLRFNPIGSWLYVSSFHGNPIVGTIVIMKTGITPEGPDVIGLTDEEAEVLIEKIKDETLCSTNC